MPQPRYRIRLPDGQRFDVTATPAKIRRTHPRAVITHRVEHDAAGNAALIPFTGAAAEPPEEGDDAPDAPASDTKAAESRETPKGDAAPKAKKAG